MKIQDHFYQYYQKNNPRQSCKLYTGDVVAVVCPKAKSCGLKGIVLDPLAMTKQGNRVSVALIVTDGWRWRLKQIRNFARQSLSFDGRLEER